MGFQIRSTIPAPISTAALTDRRGYGRSQVSRSKCRSGGGEKGKTEDDPDVDREEEDEKSRIKMKKVKRYVDLVQICFR